MGTIMVIAGGAGSGKTTLGRALCAQMGAQLVDLDAATMELVTAEIALRPDAPEADVLRDIREPRYAELIRQAREARELGDVVVTAPFTREISDPADWAALVDGLGGEPVRLVWIEVTPEERLRRMRQRGASRDAHLLQAEAAPPVPPPAVPHLLLAAPMPTTQKVARVTSHFGNGSG